MNRAPVLFTALKCGMFVFRLLWRWSERNCSLHSMLSAREDQVWLSLYYGQSIFVSNHGHFSCGPLLLSYSVFTRAVLVRAGISHHRLSVCVCICLSVIRRYCVKMAKRSITQTTPRDSPGTLVFWCENTLVDDTPFPWNLHSKWLTPLSASTSAVTDKPARRAA